MSERQTLRLELAVDSEDELRALRGALLAARASELSEIQRRAGRHSFGYGSDSARETMTDEVANHRRRHDMVDRLLGAIDEALTARGLPACPSSNPGGFPAASDARLCRGNGSTRFGGRGVSLPGA